MSGLWVSAFRLFLVVVVGGVDVAAGVVAVAGGGTGAAVLAGKSCGAFPAVAEIGSDEACVLGNLVAFSEMQDLLLNLWDSFK